MIPPYHLCHIVFVRSKSLNPAHTQGKRIIEEREKRGTRLSGAILDAACHTFFAILFCFIICLWILELMNFLPNPELLCFLKQLDTPASHIMFPFKFGIGLLHICSFFLCCAFHRNLKPCHLFLSRFSLSLFTHSICFDIV